MKETELWARLEEHLGAAYGRVWASEHNLAELRGMTVMEALAAGTGSKQIWRAVWRELELPDAER